ncbi:MAG TPA: substrate-binding domain-containing protein [Pyrinomonadaceae bacterium]|nr:substrate-binding domain-containing protein [Pyrinomonadaceae bacterium]
MRKMRVGLLVLAASAAAAVVGCVSPQQEQSGGGNTNGAGYQRRVRKEGPVRIGFSMDTLKEERWQRDKMLVEARARERGAEVQVEVANGDDARQISQVDTLLTRGVDVLIVAPHNGQVASTIVERAHRQGVPVISYDRLILNSDVDLYVSHQVTKIGQMQAGYALRQQPKGNYVLIFGSQTDNNALLLRDAQMEVLRQAIDRGDIKVVTEQHAREWQASEAQRIMEDALTKTGNNVQAVVASNDGTAGGAISALQAAGLGGKVLVTGQDAELPACQRIAKGTQAMTIYKPIKPLADSAVDAAIRLARGEQPDAPDRINNGKIDVPAILHEPITVDKANLAETVVRDGYHPLEAVYQDVPRDQWPSVPAGGATPTGSPAGGATPASSPAGSAPGPAASPASSPSASREAAPAPNPETAAAAPAVLVRHAGLAAGSGAAALLLAVAGLWLVKPR